MRYDKIKIDKDENGNKMINMWLTEDTTSNMNFILNRRASFQTIDELLDPKTTGINIYRWKPLEDTEDDIKRMHSFLFDLDSVRQNRNIKKTITIEGNASYDDIISVANSKEGRGYHLKSIMDIADFYVDSNTKECCVPDPNHTTTTPVYN